MIVPVDVDRFTTAGLQFEVRDGVGVFEAPTSKPDIFETVKATISGDNLILLPHRSSAHKRVVAILGLNDRA